MLSRRNFIYIFISSFFLVLTTASVEAQLKKVPLLRDPNTVSKSNSSARAKSLTPKSLPFWDDFSFASGYFPQDTLWENSKSVWVNTGMGINTPTIYSATFDGLDSVGMPYKAEILANGYRDKLVSRPLLLEGLSPANNVCLSFYYQWQGNGEPPDEEDYIVLEFKNDQGVWVERKRILSQDTLDRTKFYLEIHYVTGDEFFHDDFQFRFRSYGRQSGPYDTWNIDYVYLNDYRTADMTISSFPDRALGSDLTALFGSYRSAPLEHFLSNEDFDSVAFDIQSLEEGTFPDAIDYYVRGHFINYRETDTLYYSETLFTRASFNILPKERIRDKAVAFPSTANTSQFDPDAKAIDITLQVILQSKDDTDPGSADFVAEGIDCRINDTISTTFHLKDFYAYDDGEAEFALELTQPNNKAVVQFDMLTPEPDILGGFYIYFPDYGLASNQSIDFLIYQPDGDKPSENPYLSITLPVSRQGIGKFFNVPLRDAPVPVQGKFYIGWQAPPSGKPKVGFDISNDSGDKIFTNTNGIWLQNEDDFHGSLMIRPYFGEGIISGIPGEENQIAVFPNPNRGEFFIQGRYDGLAILSSTGQSVSFMEEGNGDSTKVSFRAAPGLYLLRVAKGSRVTTEKVIVVP